MYPWCKEYVGIPFVSGGRTHAGCDCYGLVRLILTEQYGYDLPLLSGDYSNALSIAETKRLFTDNVPILCGAKIDSPKEGAVALVKVRGRLCHVALYAGDGYIIHARHKVGVICERTDSPALAGCIEGWYHVSESCRPAKSLLN